MLSGVGPADHLKEHGIEVVKDLSGVGENLQVSDTTRFCLFAGALALIATRRLITHDTHHPTARTRITQRPS